MAKKLKKLVPIGSIAKFLNISPSRIRRFEKAGLLEPTFVSESGYRYYDNETVSKLSSIVAFQQFGFTYEEIGKALETQDGINDMYNALVEKRRILDMKIRQFKGLYDVGEEEFVIEKFDLMPCYYNDFHWNGKCIDMYNCLDVTFHNLAKENYSTDPTSYFIVKTSADSLDSKKIFMEQDIRVYIPIIYKKTATHNVKILGNHYCLISKKINKNEIDEIREKISSYLIEKKMKLIGDISILYTTVDLICTEDSFCDQKFRLFMHIAPIE